MPSDDESYKAYQDDPRIACQFGVRCYQKNPVHQNKYKHPPKKKQKKNINSKPKLTTGIKRKFNDVKDDEAESPDSLQSSSKNDGSMSSEIKKVRSSSLSPERNGATTKSSSVTPVKESENKNTEQSPSRGTSDPLKITGNDNISMVDPKESIKDKFMVEMPDDFYKLYELCNKISPKEPSAALKAANLLLIGPYDVLNGKLKNANINDAKKYSQHWRYYYDPPEFQTILKSDDKEGLHFGYWRDDPSEKPVFVAKNSANINCKIIPVAENVFGAVDGYMETRIKKANPFEKNKLASLHQQIKNFAKEHDITLDKSTEGMRARERKVVARTFHGAGIVVPYDKKTQLGYRELVETDVNIKKILKCVDESGDDHEREGHFTKLEEVVRFATIAADECDFGTCLELGHDLFSSGSVHVQNTAIQMLSTAYTLLNRSQFLEIAKAHIKNRRKGINLSII